MDKVKIAIIGVGTMGSAHVATIDKLDNCTVSALCDIDPEVRKKYANRKDTQIFASADELFAKGDFDAVIVAVPHYFHVPLALQALEHGKHVLTEKPISVHKKLAQQLVDAIPKYPNLKVAAMFNQRTLNAHKKIKQLIDNGELGEIRRVNWIITTWFRSQFYYDSGDWRASWRGEGGGVLLNQCPHQLDLMQWFFGMPKKVTAFLSLGKYHDIEVEDEVTAYLEYPNGATGVFITTTGEAPGTNRLEICGERGRLVYENGKINFLRNEIPTTEFRTTTKTHFGSPEKWEINVPYKPDAKQQHMNVIENFADAILKGTPLVAPAQEGIRGLELGNAMLLSGLKHKTVELPIDAEEFAVMLDELVSKSRYVKKAPTEKDNVDSASLAGSF